MTLDLPPIRGIHPELESSSFYALAGIRSCKTGDFENSLGSPLYKQYSQFEVVDMWSVQCLIGRVQASHGLWAIIDRSGKEISNISL
jgi:hypothetical protein